MDYMFRGADAFNQDLSKWNVWYVEEDIDLRYPMFNTGYEEEKKPNVEQAKERLKDKKNVESLGQQAESNNQNYFKNNPAAKEFLVDTKNKDLVWMMLRNFWVVQLKRRLQKIKSQQLRKRKHLRKRKLLRKRFP